MLFLLVIGASGVGKTATVEYLGEFLARLQQPDVGCHHFDTHGRARPIGPWLIAYRRLVNPAPIAGATSGE